LYLTNLSFAGNSEPANKPMKIALFPNLKIQTISIMVSNTSWKRPWFQYGVWCGSWRCSIKCI